MPRLKEYKTKRKFEETPEPKPKIGHSKNQLLFVIHKHRATRLHYDLRLELNGVLKSWAVPKGPSLNPADKRLAIEVEDHPFEYRTFEGTIPEGNYGAGEVLIWDEGTYSAPNATTRKESEQLIEEGYQKGHIDLVFNGEKLKGAFVLVKTSRMGDKNSWLLIKRKDEYASTKDVTKLDRSVKSGRTIEDLREENDPPMHVEKLRGAKKSKMPHQIKPMLAYLAEEPFDAKEWLYEIKWDGYRAIAEIDKHRVSLYSRNLISFNDRFPKVVEELQRLPVKSLILDGEIVLIDSKGRSRFQYMQNYQRSQVGELHYYVFDILYLDGYNLCQLPLIERKEILKALLEQEETTVVQYSDHIDEKGVAVFKEAAKRELEGIMAKNGKSIYKVGMRSHDWLKIKTHLEQEVVIGGFTEPRGSRQKFGSLLIGVYEKGGLTYVGNVGGGFSEQLLSDVYKQLAPLTQKKSPFMNLQKEISGVTWVKPQLVCEVSFAEWTDEGIMRQPIFKGLRIDKKAKEVKRES